MRVVNVLNRVITNRVAIPTSYFYTEGGLDTIVEFFSRTRNKCEIAVSESSPLACSLSDKPETLDRGKEIYSVIGAKDSYNFPIIKRYIY